MTTLTESKWNWFQFLELMEKYDSIFADRFEGVYEAIISATDLLPHVQKLLKQSHDAYVCDRNTRLSHDLREAGALNGMVSADSDDVNPEEFVGVCELTSERVKNLVIRQRKAIKRHGHYLKAKRIAERNFLQRKTSKRTSSVLQECPDIREVIEKFVMDRNIGADAWRRTGVLTFDGNARVRSHFLELRNI